MGDDEQGEEESVKLQRMLSSLIADKRKMFDLLTKILDRGKKDKDAALVQYVEQATGLWTDMMMEEHDHDQKCIENVHLMQEDCNTMLRELLSILEAGEEGTEHSEELEKLRAELLQAREDAKSKDAEIEDLKQSGVADDLEKVRSELSLALQAANNQEDHIKDLNGKIAGLEDEIEKLRKIIEDKNAAERDAAAAKEEIEKASAQLVKTKQALDAANTDLQDLKVYHDTQVKDLSQKLAEAAAQFDDKTVELGKTISGKDAEIAELLKGKDVAERDAAAAKEEIEELSAQLAKAKQALDAEKFGLQDLAAQLAKAKEALDAAQEESDREKKLVQHLRDENVMFQKRLQDLKDVLAQERENLKRVVELTNMTIENVAKEHLTNHTSVISGATQGTNTTVGLSFDDMTAKVTGVMVGGPAFNSKKINKDDVIVKIDGQQVQGNQVLDLLRGSDQPGSVVEITLKRTSVSAFMIWNAASAAA
jgi:chromosome segregation ATPase